MPLYSFEDYDEIILKRCKAMLSGPTKRKELLKDLNKINSLNEFKSRLDVLCSKKHGQFNWTPSVFGSGSRLRSRLENIKRLLTAFYYKPLTLKEIQEQPLEEGQEVGGKDYWLQMAEWQKLQQLNEWQDKKSEDIDSAQQNMKNEASINSAQHGEVKGSPKQKRSLVPEALPTLAKPLKCYLYYLDEIMNEEKLTMDDISNLCGAVAFASKHIEEKELLSRKEAIFAKILNSALDKDKEQREFVLTKLQKTDEQTYHKVFSYLYMDKMMNEKELKMDDINNLFGATFASKHIEEKELLSRKEAVFEKILISALEFKDEAQKEAVLNKLEDADEKTYNKVFSYLLNSQVKKEIDKILGYFKPDMDKTSFAGILNRVNEIIEKMPTLEQLVKEPLMPKQAVRLTPEQLITKSILYHLGVIISITQYRYVLVYNREEPKFAKALEAICLKLKLDPIKLFPQNSFVFDLKQNDIFQKENQFRKGKLKTESKEEFGNKEKYDSFLASFSPSISDTARSIWDLNLISENYEAFHNAPAFHKIYLEGLTKYDPAIDFNIYIKNLCQSLFELTTSTDVHKPIPYLPFLTQPYLPFLSKPKKEEELEESESKQLAPRKG